MQLLLNAMILMNPSKFKSLVSKTGDYILVSKVRDILPRVLLRSKIKINIQKHRGFWEGIGQEDYLQSDNLKFKS